MAAANPATSVTSPPPTATTTSARVRPHAAHARHRSSTVAERLGRLAVADLEGAVLAAGVDGEADAGLGDDRGPGRAGRAGRSASSPRDAGADEHGVAAVAEGDLDGDHAVTCASWASTSSAIRSAMRPLRLLLGAWNGSTSTVMSATSA